MEDVRYEVIVRGNNLAVGVGFLGLANITLVHCKGGPVLFDTGHHSNRPAVIEGLARRGLEPGDVPIVFLSHLHFDHCMNIDLFREATVLVGCEELEYIDDPNPDDDFIPWLIKEQLSEHHLEPVQGEGEIAQGVSYFPAPGHTPGCYALSVEADGETVVLAGDAVKHYRELILCESDMPFGSRKDSTKSIKRIMSSADRILPGHFPELVKNGDSFVWEEGSDLRLIVR